MEHEPLANLFVLVRPQHLGAMASDGYYLSDLELMFLCECAERNPVIVRRMQSPDCYHRTASKAREWVMPAGSLQEFTLVAIGAEEGAADVRGHYERLERLTRELPPRRRSLAYCQTTKARLGGSGAYLMSLTAWAPTQSGTCPGLRQIQACWPEGCRMAADCVLIRILESLLRWDSPVRPA